MKIWGHKKGFAAAALIFSAVAGLLFPAGNAAAASLCAEVKLEIKQEATLEREAFDAALEVGNQYPETGLTNFFVNVVIKDADGNAANDKFYVKVSSKENIASIDGTGTVQPASTATIHWLIIPSTGAGGTNPLGLKYAVKANISYNLNGVAQSISTFEDYITVKPQPVLSLAYVLPFEVFADEPLTTAIEAVEPFPLGVRVINTGYGPANNFQINSGQPEIIENKQDLAIDFKLLGTYVGNQKVADTLLIPFGNIPAAGVSQAAWIMATSLSGRFVKFDATFTHAAELGGQLTSLIQSVTTYTLVKDVLVDLDGRDEQFDFLVATSTPRSAQEALLNAGQAVIPDVIFESDQATPLQVVNAPGTLVANLNGGNTAGTLTLGGNFSSGLWVFTSVTAPLNGKAALLSATRSDGKAINAKNAWISKHFNKDAPSGEQYSYRLNLLDYSPPQDAQYTLNFSLVSVDTAPAAINDLAAVTGAKGGQTRLSWSATGEDGTEGSILGGRYLVQAAISSTTLSYESALVNITTNTTPLAAQNYSLSGLSGNATYYVQVWLQDTAGAISEGSNLAEVFVKPNPPNSLGVNELSTTTASVTWAGGNNYLPIDYGIWVATAAAAPVVQAAPFKDPFDRAYTFEGLAPNTTYFFYGIARSSVTGATSEQAYLGSTVTLAAVPDAMVSSQLFVSSFTLAWNAGGNPVETEYFVEISTMEDWALIAWESGWQAAPQYTLAGLTADTTYYARVKARNASGVETAYSNLGTIRTLLVDVLPPVTELAFTGPSYGIEPAFVSSATVIGLKAADALRAVGDNLGVAATTYYAVDSDTFSVYAGTFSLNAAGWHQVKYYSNDNVGNTEAVRISSIAVDDTPPAPALDVSSPVYISSGVVYVSSLSVVGLRAVDEFAGVKELAYTLDGSTYSVAAASQPFLLAEGTHTISYNAADNLGNTSGVKFSSLTVDDMAPESVFTVTGSSAILDGKLYVAGGSSVTLGALDAGAGVLELHYTLDGSTGVAASAWEFVPGAGAHTLEFYAADNLGNTESARNQVFFVDSTAPVTSAVFEGTPGLNGWYVAPVAITLTSTDTLSGVKEIFYALDGSTTAAVYVSSFGVSAEGAHTLAAYAADNAGNAEAPVDYTIKIDTTAPVVSYSIDGSSSAAGWYNKPVDVVFAGTDAVSGVAYCSSSFTLETEGLAVPATGYCDDYAGLSSTVSFTVNIDTTAPIVVSTRTPANGNGWNNSPVTVWFECTDALSGPAGCPAAIALTDEGLNISTAARAYDAAGNYADLAVEGINIDTAAPVSTAALSGIYVASDVYNSAVTLRLDVADALSGVQAAYYAVDGGTATLYTEPVQVVAVGTHTISHYAVDKASNTELARTISFEIQKPAAQDTLPPVTALTLLAPNYGAMPPYISSHTPVALNAYDDFAELGDKLGVSATIYYAIDSDTFTIYTGTFSVAGEGGHILKYYSVDTAGHAEAVKTGSIAVDDISPVTTPALDGVVGLNGWHVSAVGITVVSTDAQSGVKDVFYARDGSTAVYVSSFGVTAEGAHTLAVYAADNIGNVGTPAYYNFKIDLASPTITAVAAPLANKYGWNSSSVTVVFTGTDSVSGVAYCSPDTSAETEGSSQTVTGYCSDYAGFVTSASVIVSLDTAAPVSTAAFSGAYADGKYTGAVQITLASTDTLSGVGSLYYSLDDAGPVAYTSAISEARNSTHTLTFYAEDIAGNKEATHTVPFTITAPDTVAPVTTASLEGVTGLNGWHVSAVGITVVSTDAQSGVKDVFYALDGSTAVYVSSFSVTAEGAHTLAVYAADNSGNTGTPVDYNFKIDITSPVAAAWAGGYEISAGSNPVITTATPVALTAVDGIAGVSAIYYTLDTQFAMAAAQTYGGALTLSTGTHVLNFTAGDNAGNMAEVRSIMFYVGSGQSGPGAISGTIYTPGMNAGDTVTVLVSTDYFRNNMRTFSFATQGGSFSYTLSLPAGAYAIGAMGNTSIGTLLGIHANYSLVQVNAGSPAEGIDFAIALDNQAPTSAVTSITDGQNITSLGAITGTAADNIGAERIFAAVQDTTAGTWWNPDSGQWVTTNVDSILKDARADLTGAPSSLQWALGGNDNNGALYNLPAHLENGKTYRLYIKARDLSGNMQAGFATRSFTWGPGQSAATGTISGTINTPGMTAGEMVTVLVSNDYFRHNAMRTFSFATQGDSLNYTISLPAGAYAVGAMANSGNNALVGIYNNYSLVQVGDGTVFNGADFAMAVDGQAPDSAITSIADGDTISSLASISGIAGDNIGAESIYAAVQDVSAGAWWNPDSRQWISGDAGSVLKDARANITGAPNSLQWTLGSGDTSGALYDLPANLGSGKTYRLYIKARDLSGNMQAEFTTRSFAWSSAQSAATGTISGTIYTPGMSAGDTVTVLVSTDYYRNDTTRTFSFVTQGSSCSYSVSLPAGAYSIGAMANTGNGTLLGIYSNYSLVQVGNNTSIKGADFGLASDGQAPMSAIASISDGNTISSLAAIAGMASDNIGVEKIYAAVQDVAAGTWWNSESRQWISGDAGSVLKDARAYVSGVPVSLHWALNPGETNGALYDLPAHLENGKAYRMYIKARDLSGNMQVDFTAVTFTWSYGQGGSNSYGVISGTVSAPGLSDGAVITVLVSNSYFRYDVAQVNAIVHGGIAAYSISVDTSTVYSIGAMSGSGAGTYIGIYNNYARLSVNAGAVLAGIDFGMALDAEEPTSAITSLYNGEVVDSLNGIGGTAADNVGVAEIQLAVEDAGTGLWWNAANGQWVSTDAVSAFVSGNISMQQLPNAVSWGIQDSRSTGVFAKLTSYSGNAYRLYIRAKDFAGNVQKTYAPVWFVLNHGENTNTGRISGTISAPGLNDGAAVKLLASKGFFRDDITQSSATVHGGSLAYSISVAVPGLYAIGAISETGSYVGIYNNYAKVNISSAADITGINFSMAQDTEAPTTAITSVSGGAYLNALGSIYGTAADNVGGSVLEAALEDLATGLFWYQQNAVWATAANGSEFSAAISSTSETRGAFNWRLPMYASDGVLRGASAELKTGNTYRLYVRMRDFAGNVQQTASAVSFTWGAEPVSSATISGAIYAPELADGTAVTVSAFDYYFNHAMAKGNFVVQGGVVQYSVPVVAPSSCFIAALSGSGSYVGSYNNYERLSVSTGANITGINFNMAVDNAAPVSAISSISDGMPVTSLSAISGTAADNTWVYNMLAALQDVNSGLWWSAADSSWTASAYAFDTAGVDMWGLPGAAAWTLRDEDSSGGAFSGLTSKLTAGKKYRLYLKARDYAGNVEQSYNTVTFRWHSDISPSSGPIGIPFTITGEKFGTYAAGITTVLIGGTTAPLTQWNATVIKGTLPGTLPAGEQTVVVMRGTTTITDVAPFTVTVPAASAVTPSSGAIGLPFTITGTSFGNYVPGKTQVLLGGTTCPLTLWTDTQIKGTVPGSLAAGDYGLVVERNLNGGVVGTLTLPFKVVTPELDAIVPTYGAIGIGFTLTGANFGNYVANYTRVLIGGTTAPLTLWADGKIQGTVPGTLPSGTYAVAVERELNGGLVRSSTVAFTLVLPEAQSVTPSSGAIGLPFTITGTHFGNYVANFTRVLIGGATTPVTLWTDTRIQGTVPGGLTAGNYELIVERELNGGRAASLPLAFEVLGVNVSSITPASGPIGLPFTIYGSNFGNYSAGYTKVLMGGTTMPITLWTNVKIQGTVPGSLADGDYPVVVERNLNGGQVQSSSLTFTVASPAVYTLSPSSGPIGLPFTLTGLNFGNYLAGYTKVLIGGVAAPVTLWTDVKVQGTIPGALAPGDYALYVERAANGGVMRSSTATFTVGAPYLASVSPATAAVQAVYTLAGYNFGNYSAGYTKVRINGSTTAVTLWNDGKIQGKLPSLPAGTYPVQVQLVLNGGLGESATSYITVVEPVISSMTPVSGQARATINLYGSGFGAYDVSLTRLLMDGTTCTVSLWNDARITASVPAALAYGTHTVVAARGAAYSNGVDFLLTSAYTASMFKAVTTSVEFALGEVYVYPNPAKGGAVPVFHIECGIADSVKIEVYTISGQSVHEYTITGAPQLITDSGGSSYAYEYAWRGHIASGVYLYRIEVERAGRKLKKTGKFAVVR